MAGCAVTASVAASLAGCGSSDHGKKTPARSSSPSTFVATRWWSNAAVTAGSTIDPANPDSAAKDLHPSQTDYCTMLKQTVAAGKSILPDITSADPALLTSAKAFVAEIEKVAPPSVTSQWQLIGPAVLSLVKSGGDTSALPTVDLGALTKAADAIGADSLANCGVDLSSVTGLLPK
ncbi:MAG: hypothetical protein DLM59_13205 [Pseudonocardiales bacterium]|nr:MAG: hypothetical protein DLM59_13205 [Pseudonocardiales bacterium]